MADPEIKITFKGDSSDVDKKIEEIGQKIEKLPKRIPLGQGVFYPQKGISSNDKENAKNAEKELEKAIKLEEKYNATLETTGLTYQELTKLYSELLAERAKATNHIQIEVIDRQLTAVRKNIALMGREAQLSGAKMIGAQTSVLGVMQEVNKQWRNGVLTLRGLTQGIKLFAKSTVVLAAIQFAWEGISWAMEKAKIAFFGTADAEEKAAQKAQALADAAKEASETLLNAQHALVAARADKVREDAAKEFAEQLRIQNEEYREQIKLVNENLAANLSFAASVAKDEEKDIALEKLRLQEKKMKGLITEYEYQEKLINLETRASENRRAAEIDRKDFAKEAAKEKLRLAKEAEKDAEGVARESMVGFDLTSEEVQVQIASYKELKAEVEKYRDEYTALKVEENKWKTLAEKYGEQYKKDPTDIHAISIYEGATAHLQSIQNYEMWEEQMQQAYRDIPELVRKYGLDGMGLNQYNKERNSRIQYNDEVENQLNKAREEINKAEEEYNKASDAFTAALIEASEAASREEELALQRKGMIRWQRDNAKEEKIMQKKIVKAREKVQYMEYDALKKAEKNAMEEAEMAGENTPDGKNKKQLADVYSNELKRRREYAKRKAENSIPNTPAESKKEQKNMDEAAKLLEIIATRETYTNAQFEQAKKLLASAVKTSGSGDNAVVYQLIDFMNSTATAIGNEKRSRSKLAKEVARLKAKMANPSL